MRPTEPLGSVALRHVVEDAILLIRDNKELAPSRRKSVLSDLEILFDEAYKGSELSHGGSLFVAPTEKNAFEAFSLFNRHLSEGAENWDQRLSRSREAVKALQSGQVPQNADLETVTSLLEGLLASLRKHTRGELRREPREFKLSF
jgi:hypothetical protein